MSDIHLSWYWDQPGREVEAGGTAAVKFCSRAVDKEKFSAGGWGISWSLFLHSPIARLPMGPTQSSVRASPRKQCLLCPLIQFSHKTHSRTKKNLLWYTCAWVMIRVLVDQFKWKAINLNFISFCGAGAEHYLIRYWLAKVQIEQGVTGQGERSSFFAVCHGGFSVCRQPEYPRGSGGSCSVLVWKGKIDCCLINKENKLLRDGSNFFFFFLNKSEGAQIQWFHRGSCPAMKNNWERVSKQGFG